MAIELELAMSPSGRLSVDWEGGKPHGEPAEEKQSAGQSSQLTAEHAAQHVARAFDKSNSDGLFALAAAPLEPSLAPAFRYWRDFGARLLDQVCQLPEGVTGVPALLPPSHAEFSSLVLCVPPMPGAEYVSLDRLVSLWTDLSDWFREQVESHPDGLAGFLHERAPLWQQVGRVCFHLAENRRDPEYPFAFLATLCAQPVEWWQSQVSAAQ